MGARGRRPNEQGATNFQLERIRIDVGHISKAKLMIAVGDYITSTRVYVKKRLCEHEDNDDEMLVKRNESHNTCPECNIPLHVY